jgi:hypothetical protein
MRSAMTVGMAVLVGALTAACATGFGKALQREVPRRPPGASYPNWEYYCSNDDTMMSLDDTLKRAGREGWELVTIEPGVPGMFSCYKRPVVVQSGTPQIPQ